MSEWKEYRLGDLCERVTSGGTPNTRKNEYYGGEIPWVRTQEVNFNRIYDTEIKITKQGLDNSSAKWIPENSVIIAMYGATAGKVAINKIPLTTNQACCNLIIDESKADHRFIYYNILSRFSSIAKMAVGGAQQNLNAGMIKDLFISTPDLPTQTAIAEILSSLDDKIELNNKINQELENLAQTLFKQWFIDFEFPNENGEPYKSTGGEMVESELGEIPMGWTYKSLYDCAEYINGAAYKDKYFTISEDSLPIVKIVELKYGISSQTKHSNVSLGDKYKIVTGDILFSWSGSPETSIDIFLWADGNAWLNQHIFKVMCKNNFERVFVYSMLKYWKPVFISIAKDKQTTGLGHVTIKDLKERLQSFPTEKILEGFGKDAIPIIDLILNNLEEKKNLVKLRDTLLPKLISGELEINEISN